MPLSSLFGTRKIPKLLTYPVNEPGVEENREGSYINITTVLM